MQSSLEVFAASCRSVWEKFGFFLGCDDKRAVWERVCPAKPSAREWLVRGMQRLRRQVCGKKEEANQQTRHPRPIAPKRAIECAAWLARSEPTSPTLRPGRRPTKSGFGTANPLSHELPLFSRSLSLEAQKVSRRRSVPSARTGIQYRQSSLTFLLVCGSDGLGNSGQRSFR